MNIFIHEWKRQQKAFFFWCIGFATLIFGGMAEYTAAETMDAAQMESLMDAFPDIVLALFGMNNINIATELGFYSVLSFYITLAFSVYGSMLGYAAIYTEQNNKTGDFLYTKPLARAHILLFKLLARILILFTCFLFVQLMGMLATNNALYFEVLLFNLQSLYAGFALLCFSIPLACVLRRPGDGAAANNIVIAIFFFISFAFEVFGNRALKALSFFKYIVYQDHVNASYNPWLFVCGGLLCCIVLAGGIVLFNRRAV